MALRAVVVIGLLGLGAFVGFAAGRWRREVTPSAEQVTALRGLESSLFVNGWAESGGGGGSGTALGFGYRKSGQLDLGAETDSRVALLGHVDAVCAAADELGFGLVPGGLEIRAVSHGAESGRADLHGRVVVKRERGTSSSGLNLASNADQVYCALHFALRRDPRVRCSWVVLLEPDGRCTLFSHYASCDRAGLGTAVVTDDASGTRPDAGLER